MSSWKLFRDRYIRDRKYQYRVIRSIADWTIIIYLIIPALLFIIFQYRSWWMELPMREKRADRMTDEAFQAVADQAVIECLGLQEEAGVDIVSDGEQRKHIQGMYSTCTAVF